MSAVAELQTEESQAAFESGSKRKVIKYDMLDSNTYANKRRKVSSNNEQQSLHRGRYGFDQLGILRTKPGKAREYSIVHTIYGKALDVILCDI